jgi:5'-methylthioadenosine phosphorylase
MPELHATKADLLILIAVLLPPKTLDIFGPVAAERTVETPYGVVGPLALRTPAAGPAVWVQPYTGLPTRTDPRAIIYAAHQLGVHYVLNWDTGVALNPVLERGQSVIAVDYIDWTRHQPQTFDDHFTDERSFERRLRLPPFCPHMVGALNQVLPAAAYVVYLGVDGPRRETPAEARLFRSWGADVLGQNLVPEVALARSAGLCYAGMVTIGDRSADQLPHLGPGKMRVGLEQTIQVLPAYVNLLGALPTCTCALGE